MYTYFAWIIIVSVYLLSVLFNAICARLTVNKNNEPDDDFVKLKWDINEDLKFMVNVIFVPVWNTICAVLYVVAFTLNRAVKFITKQ